MRRQKTLQTRLIAVGAALFGMASGLAAAETESITVTGSNAGTRKFMLTDDNPSETIRLSDRQELRICNRAGRGIRRPALSVYGSPLMDLEIGHDGRTERIRPGECRTIEAQVVDISAPDLRNSAWSLEGRLSYKARNRDEQGTRAVAANTSRPESSASSAADISS